MHHACASRPRGQDLLIQQKVKKLMPSDKHGLTVRACMRACMRARVRACMYACMYVCMVVCMPVCLCIYMSVCPFVHPSIHPSISLSLSICLSAGLRNRIRQAQLLKVISFWRSMADRSKTCRTTGYAHFTLYTLHFALCSLTTTCSHIQK